MRRRSLIPALALVVGTLSGCSSEPIAPTGATLDVSFSTTADDDGAVLFTISGGSVDSVEATGLALYSAQIDASTLRVILVGDLSSGKIARIHIADERRLSQYSATINQVAARRSYTQRDPLSYSLTVAH